YMDELKELNEFFGGANTASSNPTVPHNEEPDLIDSLLSRINVLEKKLDQWKKEAEKKKNSQSMCSGNFKVMNEQKNPPPKPSVKPPGPPAAKPPPTPAAPPPAAAPPPQAAAAADAAKPEEKKEEPKPEEKKEE
ncbi:hypothetical protein PFISCL1PPCAC_20277, partial [Pristionchus fissidentatus]